MADEKPAPLVGPETDLTDFPFMPIMVARLKQSRAWLVCKRRPELAFYMLNLWTASWHGRPAGSLEDDDLVLADLAMASEKVWAKIKTEVLRGWVRCADGRIYHPVVAEHAREAWGRKTARRTQTEAARVAREAARVAREAAKLGSPPNQTEAATISVTEKETEIGTANETASKGQGQGQGQGQGDVPAERATEPPKPNLELECRVLVGEEPVVLAQDFHVLTALLDDGITPDDIRTGIREALEKRDPAKRFRSWSSFIGWCRTAAQNRLAASPRQFTRPPPEDGAPRFDFGGGVTAPYHTIQMVVEQGEWLPAWGPGPGKPGCRIPADLLAEILGKVPA